MLLQAILLGLVAMLGNAEYLFGTSLLSRPLVMGTLTGIVLGDVQTGVTLGATLELAFMGAFSIGASIPPEMISGTVLGTAFTITTGAGPETGFFGVNLIIGVIVACGYYAGGPAVQALLNVIPTWISNGLQITMGLLPAIGFGLLLMMIMDKNVACFFFLGFALSVYLKIPVTAIAIFGAIIAIVLTQLRSNSALTAIEGGVDEDDDF